MKVIAGTLNTRSTVPFFRGWHQPLSPYRFDAVLSNQGSVATHLFPYSLIVRGIFSQLVDVNNPANCVLTKGMKITLSAPVNLCAYRFPIFGCIEIEVEFDSNTSLCHLIFISMQAGVTVKYKCFKGCTAGCVIKKLP